MFGRKDERAVFPDATVAESPQSLGGAVLPEMGPLRKAGKRKLFLIFLGGGAVCGPACGRHLFAERQGRGGNPAGETKLLTTEATNPAPGANAQLDKAAKELTCVQ